MGVRGHAFKARHKFGFAYLKKMDTPISAIKLPATSELLKGSWRLYKNRFGVLIGIVLLPFVVTTAGTLFSEPLPGGGAAFGGVIIFAGIVLGIISYIAVVYAIKGATGILEAYKLAVPSFFPYLWISALTALTTVGGYALAVVPGLLCSIWFMFAIFAFLIDGRRGFEAMLLSKEYVRGYFWPLVGRLVIFIIIAMIFMLPFSFIGSYLGAAVSNWLQAIPQILIAPFSFIYFYLLYQALRGARPELASGFRPEKKGFFIFMAILGIVVLATILAAFGGLFYFSLNKIDPPFI